MFSTLMTRRCFRYQSLCLAVVLDRPAAMDKLAAIEAEMAKFEREISQGRAQGTIPPPMPPQQHQGMPPRPPPPYGNAPPMFIPRAAAPPGFMMPHQLMSRHAMPPMPPRPAYPPMPRPMGGMPMVGDPNRFGGSGPSAAAGSSAAIIEAAPTSYSKTVQPGQSAAIASGVMMPKKAPFGQLPGASGGDSDDESAAAMMMMGAGSSAAPGPSKKPKLPATQQPAYSAPGANAFGEDGKKAYRYVRVAGNEIWEDPSLQEWDPNDYRLFCGDLGNEVSDELLAKTFRKYPSFVRAKVVRHHRTNKSQGYGFVAFRDPDDFLRAMREMNGKYVGNRPIKLKKSRWKERDLNYVRKKMKDKKKLGLL